MYKQQNIHQMLQELYNNLYKTYTEWCINIQVRYHVSVQISPKHRDNRQLSCNITRLIQCRGYNWDRLGLTYVTPMIPVILLIDVTGGWRRGRGQIIWLITSAENEKKKLWTNKQWTKNSVFLRTQKYSSWWLKKLRAVNNYDDDEVCIQQQWR